MSGLTVDRVSELFSADVKSGEFRRKKARGPSKQGSVAGYVSGNGYRYLMIDRELYLEHRLVWFVAHGKWPSDCIDHINGIKTDNRIENLREATSAQNLKNTSKPKTNTSGFKGVSFEKAAGKWSAKARANGSHHHLGYFASAEDASNAYQRFARVAHGQFFKEA